MSYALNTLQSQRAPLIPVELSERSFRLESFTDIPSKIFDQASHHLTVRNFSFSPIKFSKKALILKTALSVGGLLGRIPLINISKDFETQIPGLGSAFAATNFLALGSFFVWASCHIVNQSSLTFAITESSKTSSKEICKKTALLAFNIFNGFVSLIPSLIISWDYNRSQPYLIAFSALDATSPIYSLQLLTNEILSRSKQTLIEKKILKLKSHLTINLDQLIEKQKQAPVVVLQDFFDLADKTQSIEKRFDALLTLISNDALCHIEPSASCLETSKYRLSHVLGFILLGIQLAGLAVISYQGLGKITDNSYLKTAMSSYVVVCNMFLMGLLLQETSYKLLNGVHKLFQKKPTYTYISERVAPSAALVARIFTFCICLPAFVPAAQVSMDHLSKELFWPTTVGYGLGFVLMDYSPLRELLDDGIGICVKKFAKEPAKYEYLIYKQLSEINQIFKSAKADSMARLLLKFSCHPQVKDLLTQHSLSIDDLNLCVGREPDLEMNTILATIV